MRVIIAHGSFGATAETALLIMEEAIELPELLLEDEHPASATSAAVAAKTKIFLDIESPARAELRE
jgi:hypothetical protein